MDKQLLKEINDAYYRLELKQAEIVHSLSHRIFELESGWYSGHYHKDENGNWFRESYPIPVIGVKGFCDIEIQFDKISVSTKLNRTAALAYSFDKFAEQEFEAYGVEDYLADFYHPGHFVLGHIHRDPGAQLLKQAWTDIGHALEKSSKPRMSMNHLIRTSA